MRRSGHAGVARKILAQPERPARKTDGVSGNVGSLKVTRCVSPTTGNPE